MKIEFVVKFRIEDVAFICWLSSLDVMPVSSDFAFSEDLHNLSWLFTFKKLISEGSVIHLINLVLIS